MTRISLAIVVAAALIATAIGLTHRYSVVATPNGDNPSVWIVDQISGDAKLCALAASKFACYRPSPDIRQAP